MFRVEHLADPTMNGGSCCEKSHSLSLLPWITEDTDVDIFSMTTSSLHCVSGKFEFLCSVLHFKKYSLNFN